MPQIGWNPVSWRRPAPLTEGLPDPCAFYHANSFAPRPAGPGARARHRRLRQRVRERRGHGRRSTGCSSTPRSPGPTGSGCSGTSCAAACQWPHDPAARGRHPRRQGGAAARRATSTTRPSTPTTRSRPHARSWRRARASCTWWTSTAPAQGAPASLGHLERITRELEVPVQYGGGLRSLASVRAALAAGADARGARHGGVHGPGAARPRARDVGRARGRGRGRARRPGVGGRLDEGDADARRGRDRAPAAPRRLALRLHERGPRRDARGPGPRRGAPGSRRPSAGASSTRAASARSRTCARCGRAAREPRRGDLGQGAVRGPLQRRRRARRRSRSDA